MRSNPEHPGVFELAAEWALIAELLRCPSEGFWNRLRVATILVDDPELLAACNAARSGANEVAYRCMFGPNGEIRLVESAYRECSCGNALQENLLGLYSAFGFQTRSEVPDHIVTMASFVGHLRYREGLARLRRSRREIVRLCVAVQQVIRGHLHGFVEPLTERLVATEIPYLSHVGYALLQRSGLSVEGVRYPGFLKSPRKQK
ncbi:MAG: hypothetical protein GY906_40210 [bacterium]|nr:hypothetical protein [bacterium]